MSSKEREQTKALLARVRQMLDSDEGLRQKLEKILTQEMVSRADFLGETQKLWQALKPRQLSEGRASSRQSLPLTSTEQRPMSAHSLRSSGSPLLRERAGSPGRGPNISSR